MYGPHSRYREYFDTVDWPDFTDRYNIAPSATVPIVRLAPDGRRVANLLRWGLVPHWAKDPAIGARLNNARAESVADKPSFRSAYRQRRCLVPAAGFYEWQATPEQRKQPWFIRLRHAEPMAMGGLWESWANPDGEILRTFCIVTTAANELMAPIHDRMPVIIAAQDRDVWLGPGVGDPERLQALLAPYQAASMEAFPVSRRVSNAREEGPDLIAPIVTSENS